MANKVRYGLANTKYAIYNATEGTYAAPKAAPGAVSLSLSREGGDSSDFYAGDLELAYITDEMRVDLLAEVVDETSGIQYEVTDAEPPQFALITEMQGDSGPIGFVFYNCKASRPELSANTKNDSPDVDTDTLSLRIAAQDFTIGGVKKGVVQGHIEKTAENAAKYASFFQGVVIPGQA